MNEEKKLLADYLDRIINEVNHIKGRINELNNAELQAEIIMIANRIYFTYRDDKKKD